MTCTYAQQSTPLLVGPNTIITSLENKDDTQNLFGSPKIEKNEKSTCREKTKSKMNPYFDLYGTKKKVKYTFSSKILLTT